MIGRWWWWWLCFDIIDVFGDDNDNDDNDNDNDDNDDDDNDDDDNDDDNDDDDNDDDDDWKWNIIFENKSQNQRWWLVQVHLLLFRWITCLHWLVIFTCSE